METPQYCIIQLEPEKFVGIEVARCRHHGCVPEKAGRISFFGPYVETGLWLSFLRGVPTRSISSAWTKAIVSSIRLESVSTSNLAPMKAGAASALFLPAGTIIPLSRTEPSDEFAICFPKRWSTVLRASSMFLFRLCPCKARASRRIGHLVNVASAAGASGHRQPRDSNAEVAVRATRWKAVAL